MKHPKIRAQANLSVKVPGLSGGINVHDTLSEIEDNQLTAADNVWWHNSALRTRPGLRYTEKHFERTYNDTQWNNVQWVSDRETLIIHTAYSPSGNNPGSSFKASRLTQEKGNEQLGQDGKVYWGAPMADKSAPTAFGCVAPMSGSVDVADQTRYYFFLSNGDIIGEKGTEYNPEDATGWKKVEPYVPTVSIDGKLYQAMNMLTGKFISLFSADGNSDYFKLPYSGLSMNDGENVTVEITLLNAKTDQTQVYTFTFLPTDYILENNNKVMVKRMYIGGQSGQIPLECVPYYSSSSYAGGSLYLKLDWTVGELRAFFDLRDSAGSMVTQNLGYSNGAPMRNAIKITAWNTIENKRMKICKMTQCAWFGNSRLFVCGNPEERNLVHWSDANNPLYFPENNYVYVGDYSQTVTAMRRQGELLAIFTENELHGMTYVLGDEDDYEYAKQAGIDATSVSMSVALTSIHAGIGCDCPDSIRLVNNRLVWATSKGKVYMLPSVNQYNERNVREISRNIFPLLSQHSADVLKSSFAGEFGGYYVLLVENVLYLLDAQTSAFSSFNYYAKEDSAQKALPWYRWTLPKGEFYCMMANDTVMQMIIFEGNVGKIYAVDGDTDDGVPINGSFTTKIFDFDRPDKKKAVNQLYIELGDSPESAVDVSYITEHDEYTDAWQLQSSGDYSDREPGYMRTHRLTPHISRSRVFGFRCDCQGAVSVGDIVLKFKEQGVVR